MPDEKKEFKKVAVPPELKRDIAIIAASEGRYEYEIVADAMALYKRVAIGKSVKSRGKTPVPVAEVISTH